MQRLEAAGYPIVLTVHDEIVCEVPIGFGSLEEFKHLLIAAPIWTADLPIAAKVREGLRFNKPAEADETAEAAIIDDDDETVESTAEIANKTVIDDETAEIDNETAVIADEAPELVKPDPPEPAEPGPGAGGHVVLIDISTIIFRAYHAARGESNNGLPVDAAGLPIGTAEGPPVDAVPILRRLLEKLLQGLQAGTPPTHLAAVFDAPGLTFRNAIYPDYKAQRPPWPEDLVPQLPMIREVVRAFELPCVEQAGFEADDVIATYARQARERGAAVTIVASDKDLMQLVTDRLVMFDPMKDRRIGIAEVIEKFGVPPEQVADVQALAGDSTDNVPGVPRIGLKTAAKLIVEYGGLEQLLARAGEIGRPNWRQALLDNAAQARLSRRLVQLDDAVALDVPLDALAVHGSIDTAIDADSRAAAPDIMAEDKTSTPTSAAKSTPGFTFGPAPPLTFEQIRAAFERKPDEAPGHANGKGNDHDYAGNHDGYPPHGKPDLDTGRQVAFYIYRHADGSKYLGVKKTSTKQFPQFHWTGAAWAKGAPAGPKIPYRLPELVKAPLDAWVLICAGEKDADSAANLGFVATTNPEGERKGAWVAELNAWFAGRKRVAIMEDNDATGQAHVLEVANALRGIVPDIRIVTFRELPEHGDLTDWLESRATARPSLRARIEAAKPFYRKPQPAPLRDWVGKPVPQPEYTVPGPHPGRASVPVFGRGRRGQVDRAATPVLRTLPLSARVARLHAAPGAGDLISSARTPKTALHWRQAAINEHYGVDYDALADAGLQLFSMIEHDTILAATSRNGIVEPTAAYDWLYELAGDTKPVLIGIASTSNIFAGNENDRTEVQQFTKLLGRASPWLPAARSSWSRTPACPASPAA